MHLLPDNTGTDCGSLRPHQPSVAGPPRPPDLADAGHGQMEVTIRHWRGVADCTWGSDDESRGRCRLAFDTCCPDCRHPGDDCPLAWGRCNHHFHMHCIEKWILQNVQRPQCPMCRADWEYKKDSQPRS
eukprot:gene8012-1429_t